MTNYNLPPVESSALVADHLRSSRAAIAQSKLNLIRLRRCYSSPRIHQALDNLCGGLDAAISALERLDFGRPPGAGQ